MNLTFLVPGKAREDFLVSGYREYLKRLSGYAKTDLVFLPEEKTGRGNAAEIAKALDKEADRVLSRLREKDLLVLLDIHAPEIDSQGLADSLSSLSAKRSNIVFCLGSSHGLSDRLRKRADFSFSLSKMTFTHYLALLLLLEQVYRAMKMLAGETYDK